MIFLPHVQHSESRQMNAQAEIIITGDGSHTLYLPEQHVHYHSVYGALNESEHIFIRNGLYELDPGEEVRVLEMGFGTGLNALLSLRGAAGQNMHVHYTAIEKHPLPSGLAERLNYPELTGMPKPLFLRLHACYAVRRQITPFFSLEVMHCDVRQARLEEQAFSLVYYDAFDPGKQGFLWTERVFTSVYRAMKKGGILLTYSARGSVKRNLRSAGFVLESLPGPLGKREITRALKL